MGTTNKTSNRNPGTILSSNTFFIFLLILITTSVYFKSLNNHFINWDDNTYVVQNSDIRTLHGDSVSYSLNNLFTSYVLGNYHPITMLSYSLEYNIFKLNPKAYHTTNLLLHILNTLLIFYFIVLLTQQRIVAFITALLFSVHPMHAESVLWVAERKDLLYTFFYFSAACAYLFYLKKEKHKLMFFSLTIIFFLLSLLSKGMAVSFPLFLFVIDYFLERKITIKTFLQKFPLLLLSLVFGIIAIEVQQYTKALDIENYNFFERILFSCYGLITYLWKLIIPVNLSCFYAYPEKKGDFYPFIYYVSPIIVIGLAFLVFKSRRYGKDILFGFLFFIVTIVLVLQILPVGSSMVSERYTYIPYIGLFFIIARWINNRIQTVSTQNYFLIFGLTVFIIFCCCQTFQRIKVWHDSTSLWTDAVKKDNTNPFLYDNRGNSYYLENQYKLAVADFTKAIDLNLRYEGLKIYFKRGMAYSGAKQYNEAITDFTTSIENKKTDSIVYFKRGYAYLQTRQYKEALEDYNHVIRIDSTSTGAYNDRGLVYFYTGNYIEAIDNFNKAILLQKNYPEAYLSRGSAYLMIGRKNEAIADYSMAINYSPNYTEALYNRAVGYLSVQKYDLALKDALKAKELGYTIPQNLFMDIEKGLNSVR